MASNAIALLGRILMSAIFIWAGWGKLMNPSGTIGMLAHHDLPLPQVGFLVAVVVELVGGLAVLVGFRTRWVGAILAAWCVATAFIGHYPMVDLNTTIHFMKNICMAGGFLQLAAWGGGRFSFDRS